jgi:hypothetical protein
MIVRAYTAELVEKEGKTRVRHPIEHDCSALWPHTFLKDVVCLECKAVGKLKCNGPHLSKVTGLWKPWKHLAKCSGCKARYKLVRVFSSQLSLI